MFTLLARFWSLLAQATFIAERASSITADEVRTKSHTIVLTNPAIDATGFDMKQSVAGSLFEFGDGHCGVTATLTSEDESTRYVRLPCRVRRADSLPPILHFGFVRGVGLATLSCAVVQSRAPPTP